MVSRTVLIGNPNFVYGFQVYLISIALAPCMNLATEL